MFQLRGNGWESKSCLWESKITDFPLLFPPSSRSNDVCLAVVASPQAAVVGECQEGIYVAQGRSPDRKVHSIFHSPPGIPRARAGWGRGALEPPPPFPSHCKPRHARSGSPALVPHRPSLSPRRRSASSKASRELAQARPTTRHVVACCTARSAASIASLAATTRGIFEAAEAFAVQVRVSARR